MAWHIIWVHIHAKFEDLLNTSAVISKIGFDQWGMLHQDYQSFGPRQTCQDTSHKSYYTKWCKGFAGN